MAMKNTAEVVIAGRVYKISGYESPEYLHQIAVYLNDKMSELQKTDGYRKQNTDQKQLLLNMNLADDFFKSRRQAEKLSADLEKKDRELYSVRHDLIEAQLALENQKKALDDLREKEKALKKEVEAQKKRLKELEDAKASGKDAALDGDGGAVSVPSSGSVHAQTAQNQGQAQNQVPNQNQNQNQNTSRQNHGQGRRR